jgi:hypothetical protein
MTQRVAGQGRIAKIADRLSDHFLSTFVLCCPDIRFGAHNPWIVTYIRDLPRIGPRRTVSSPTLTMNFIISFSIGATLLIIRWLFQSYNSPLNEVPGPRSAAWSRWWLAYTLLAGKAAQRFVELDLRSGVSVTLQHRGFTFYLWHLLLQKTDSNQSIDRSCGSHWSQPRPR